MLLLSGTIGRSRRQRQRDLTRCSSPGLYYEAQKRDTLYGLLVVKDGKLIAEDYFNGAYVNEMDKRASVGKSYVSALTGIAIIRWKN